MSVVYIVLGIVVGVLLTVVLPWALLRQLDREDEGREMSEGPPVRPKPLRRGEGPPRPPALAPPEATPRREPRRSENR